MEHGPSPDDHLDRVRELVDGEHADGSELVGTALALHLICRAAAKILPARRVALSLLSDHGPLGVVAALDPKSHVIEELQFILGEGPGWDAFASRSPVLVPDLQGDGGERWPGYCPAVGGQGVRAAFAFPLTVGSSRLGVLGVYRDRVGPMSDETLADALAFADLATHEMLDGQEETDGPGTPAGFDDVLDSRFSVYQAQGMVMVQLGVPLVEAMARLRARAYAEDRTLGAVARDVVARRLVFDQDER